MGFCRTVEFIHTVETANDPELVIMNEVVYLRDCYKVLSSLKKAFTIYRNACKSLDDDLKALCLKGFVLTVIESGELKRLQNEQIANEHRNLRPVKNIDKLILTYERLLLCNTSYLDLVIGLSGLTGRRVAEIACSAEFTPVSNNRVIFNGQLKTKTRGELPAYEIPVLGDSKLVITALDDLRRREQSLDLRDNTELFHNRCSKAISQRIKKHFSEFFPDPKAKDLRAIYGEICYSLLDDDSIAKMRYMSDILGHGVNDNLTGQSYLDFYIDDIYY